MRLGCDLSVLEELTSNAKQIQDDVLNKILKANANTEYLSRFLEGSSDKELFKKNVPVVSYEDVKPYIDRVANGEPTDIISGEPITTFNRRYTLHYLIIEYLEFPCSKKTRVSYLHMNDLLNQ